MLIFPLLCWSANSLILTVLQTAIHHNQSCLLIKDGETGLVCDDFISMFLACSNSKHLFTLHITNCTATFNVVIIPCHCWTLHQTSQGEWCASQVVRVGAAEQVTEYPAHVGRGTNACNIMQQYNVITCVNYPHRIQSTIYTPSWIY